MKKPGLYKDYYNPLLHTDTVYKNTGPRNLETWLVDQYTGHEKVNVTDPGYWNIITKIL